ncbi:MAG: DNA gyrase subunit A [Clostridia bacterium]|nr:DNA gyrase subunit A [Clostridia bacterium]
MAEEFDYSGHVGQTIHDIRIEDEIKTAYIDYAMSVIVSRALPDVRDGLKPVHRRVLYAMDEDHLTYDKAFRKSATTVGDVLGRYHPHGDTAVYDTMVRLAQPFSLRYPLIEGHGNFGNIDGDPPAAYRYTEAKMSKIANEMLADIDKNVVDFDPNFDNTRKEPRVLPARFPNLLVNGSVGIAVGMATNVPPHNLTEVCKATEYLIDNPECAIPELMQFIKGPDFPTYGTIYGTAGIYEAYMTGKGHIKVRAKAHFEEKHGRTSIIVTELPYQVNRSLLLENMVNLIKNKRIEGISDIRNESGRKGMRIVIEIKKDANPQIVLNQLYKFTQMEDTCAVNMLALVNGEPKVLNLKEILTHYIRHREEVTVRRVRYDLDKAEKEAHLYEGYVIVIDNIDEVVSIIRSSGSIPEAKTRLAERFSLSDAQTQAIVEMTLGKLTGMERQKILDRLEALYALIKDLKEILGDESRITAIIKTDLEDIIEKYGDERRTNIEEVEDEILIEDLIEKQNCVITVTNDGYIKRIPADTYSAQRRGGKGVTAMGTKEEDFVKNVFVVFSHDTLLLISNKGKMYRKKCYEVPEAGRTAKGTNFVNLLQMEDGEEITAGLTVKEFRDDEYLVFLTKNGIIKRVNLIQYQNKRTKGLFAIKLDEGDVLLTVLKTTGNDQILCATHDGMSLRFNEREARDMGRTARGVRAISLRDGDYLVGACVIPNGEDTPDRKLLLITENGFGKRVDTQEFGVQPRYRIGLKATKLGEKTGKLTGIALVSETDDLMMITDGGMFVRTPASDIPMYGRFAGGVIVMRMKPGEKLVGIDIVAREQEPAPEESEGGQEDDQ